MIKFIRDCIPALLVLLFCSALSAQQQPHWTPPLPVLYTATCNADATDLTTYTHTVTTGVTDNASVVIVVGIMAEDSATNFDISSVTVDGSAATVYAQDSQGVAVISGIASTNAKITSAASVDVAVTYSEAVSSSVVCVWAIENLEYNLPSYTAQSERNTTGAALTDTLNTVSNGFAFGVCTETVATGSTTWTGLTEVEDTQHAEADYSNASLATTGADITPSCDWTGTGDSAGAFASYGNRQEGPAQTKYKASCATSATDTNVYTFNTNTLTGLTDAQEAMIVVGIIGEDSATAFTISSVTIEGNAATAISGSAGNTALVSASFYRSATKISNAAAVDVVVTFSENITGAGICVWALEGSGRPITVLDSAASDDTDGNIVNLDQQRAPNGGYVLGICGAAATGTRATWLGITEVDDADATEFAYTTAEQASVGGGMPANSNNASRIECNIVGSVNLAASVVSLW